MIACVVLPDIVSLVEGKGKPDHSPYTIVSSSAGFVKASSLEVAKLGVRAGMRKRHAQSLCPDALVTEWNPTRYIELIEAIGESLTTYTTKVETVAGFWHEKKRTKSDYAILHPSGAVFYLDLGKLLRTDALSLAQRLQQSVSSQFTLQPLIGLASGKFPASLAVRRATSEQPKLVRRGDETRFVASFPVTLLPLDAESRRHIAYLGITTLGAFAALGKAAIVDQFGKKGRLLYELATGHDPRPVIPPKPKFKERLETRFPEAIEDCIQVHATLQNMGCDLARTLQTRGLTTRQLTLTIYFDHKGKATARRILRQTMFDGRLLGRMLLRLFAEIDVTDAITILEVTATELAPIVLQQLDLFGTQDPLDNRLSDLLEHMTTRFGTEDIYRVERSDEDHWLLEDRFLITSGSAA